VPSAFSASATEPSPLLSAAVSASARASPPLHYILRAACRLVSRRTKARGLSISANAVTTSADALLNASKRNATMVRQRMRGSTTSVSKWTSWTTRYHDVFCVMPIMRQWLIELRHHNTYFCWFVGLWLRHTCLLEPRRCLVWSWGGWRTMMRGQRRGSYSERGPDQPHCGCDGSLKRSPRTCLGHEWGLTINPLCILTTLFVP
jgi:hypothetical protein